MMHRLTTDNPTDNIEASLNLFYVRDGDAFIRGGGDAPDYADISVTDFIRKTARTLCPDMLLPESAEEISFAMAEYLFDGYEEPSGLIALLYTAAWSYAELRERLKAYEDTGLSPIACEESAKIEKGLSDGGYSTSRMVELMCADKEGRVIVLPCKVGDTIWVTGRDNVPREMELEAPDIRAVCTDEDNLCMTTCNRKPDGFCAYRLRNDGASIGKTVFLTREEAEKALAEMEGMKEL